MPGKNFVLRTSPQETAAAADAAVGDLARRLALQLLETPDHPAPNDPTRALAVLHLLDHLQQAWDRLQR
ncbi:hypothetical protein [Streptomyces sp. NPDC054901]